jgi:16S rRNA (guanine966-N2)-methyltransferase
VVRTNLKATRLDDRATVVPVDAIRWLDGGPFEAPFDVAIVDPPYAETGLLANVLSALGRPDGPLADDARVVAKHFWRDRPPERIGMLAVERERRFGETALTFYRRSERAESERSEPG